eukprot:13201735-Alexandrium_andersonii.AAC.1
MRAAFKQPRAACTQLRTAFSQLQTAVNHLQRSSGGHVLGADPSGRGGATFLGRTQAVGGRH